MEHWLRDHTSLIMLLTTIVIPAIVNGLRESREGRSGIGGFLDSLIDRLSVTTKKDAPGTFKLPGMKSQPPQE